MEKGEPYTHIPDNPQMPGLALESLCPEDERHLHSALTDGTRGIVCYTMLITGEPPLEASKMLVG